MEKRVKTVKDSEGGERMGKKVLVSSYTFHCSSLVLTTLSLAFFGDLLIVFTGSGVQEGFLP